MVVTALGMDLANALTDWVTMMKEESTTSGHDIVKEWKKWAEFGKEYTLRGNVVDDEEGSAFVRETVVTVDIEADGRLRVRDRNQQERLLVADYLV